MPTARVVAAEAPPLRAAKRAPVATRHIVEDDAEEPGTNYALRLTEALEAISSAQKPAVIPHANAAAPQRSAHGTPSVARPEAATQRHGSDVAEARPPKAKRSSALAGLGGSFRNLPPIRLPIGPAIPWKFGVPGLVLLVVVMIFVARPMSQADSQVSRLPTPEAYPVQQEAPLFTDAQPTPAPTPAPTLGVADSGGVGFDVLDVGLKLIAVLALAYGSLLLLKRTGMGGAAAIKGGGKGSGMQVVASLTLAPNRTVHLLKVPGGKTVLVGATPNQVNLIVDLGDIPEDLESEATGSFFDILKGKIPQ